MIFLWKESKEDTCARKNLYEDEYFQAYNSFEEKYGFFGEKLQTEEELEENRKRGGGMTVHFMHEMPEYQSISERYYEEEKCLDAYRNQCKDEALDLLKKYFFDLWD